ncbi:MAG: hypothetical protein ACP5VR_10795 [Acidimicrobiales bacterium]
MALNMVGGIPSALRGFPHDRSIRAVLGGSSRLKALVSNPGFSGGSSEELVR